jgi:hypothetical protein
MSSLIVDEQEAPAEVAFPEGAQHLEVIAQPGLAAALHAGWGFDARDVGEFREVLQYYGGEVEPLFPRAATDRARHAERLPTYDPTRDEAAYFAVTAPEEALPALRDDLDGLNRVVAAYLLPPTSSPGAFSSIGDVTDRQGYLARAPDGLDARYAWERDGGRGAGVTVVDIEGAWCVEHEAYAASPPTLVAGAPYDERRERDHGTAVLGITGASHDGDGLSGFAPDAEKKLVAHQGITARAISEADDACGPGDLILIEAQRWGPLHVEGEGEVGAIPIEWWPGDFLAVQAATRAGRIVVAAAGNGDQYLLHPAYDVPPGDAAPWSSNPFARAVGADSGSILVGAGAPPDEYDLGPARSRLPFSNWGPSIDAQGWGEHVVTSGYGDLDESESETSAYTARFRGTSAAAAMVAGAVACLQGALRAVGASGLSPAEARAWLRAACTPQQDAPGRPVYERVGGLPDLRSLLDNVPA